MACLHQCVIMFSGARPFLWFTVVSFKYKVIAGLAVVILPYQSTVWYELSRTETASNMSNPQIKVDLYLEDSMIIPPLVAVTIVNAFMTGSLIVSLRKARKKYTGHGSLVELTTLYGVNTGPLILDRTGHLIVARLHMNTLLCVLNSRKLLSSRGVTISEADTGTGTLGINIIARAN
ncbi:hypothetical protein C8Q80DRAFT_1120084 [Daedaleopsis nitida]|nr:hypothetical protein C8Q80DRAFT_1120084 [Daedaleopsis nitida]